MLQVDVAIVGAGIAGLTCGQILAQSNHQVIVLEKSRGVGGRLATRRLPNARADHGTCSISCEEKLFHRLVQTLVDRNVVQIWTDTIHRFTSNGVICLPDDRSPCYVAPDGMSAIAKSLTPGLDIRFSQRVIQLELTPAQTWQLTLEETTSELDDSISTVIANSLILTIPAPQAIDLLTPLVHRGVAPETLETLRLVKFNPCYAVIAGYSADCLMDWHYRYPDVKAIALEHSELAWLGLDSSKRRSSYQPIFVLQSTAKFAQQYLEAQDLMLVGQTLLNTAAELLTPWLAQPEWMQVHRWRYAFAAHPLAEPYVVANAIAPMICAGDWCGGRRVEDAFHSGLEAARYLNLRWGRDAIVPDQFWLSLSP